MKPRFVWRSAENKPRAIVRPSDLGVSVAGFQATYRANSITLVAIPKA